MHADRTVGQANPIQNWRTHAQTKTFERRSLFPKSEDPGEGITVRYAGVFASRISAYMDIDLCDLRNTRLGEDLLLDRPFFRGVFFATLSLPNYILAPSPAPQTVVLEHGQDRKKQEEKVT